MPASDQIRAAVTTDDAPACFAALAGLPRVVSLLTVPAYADAIFEGLIASVGGLDAQLSAAAIRALQVRGRSQQCICADKALRIFFLQSEKIFFVYRLLSIQGVVFRLNTLLQQHSHRLDMGARAQIPQLTAC